MTKTELAEALDLANQVITGLVATLTSPASTAGAQLKWQCGAFTAGAAAALNVTPTATSPAPFWAAFAACFEQARTAGASYAGMDAVRKLAAGFTPQTPAATAVANFALRMALVELAQILAATTFTSRADIDRAIGLIDPAFDCAETVAADRLDNVAYQALIALHGAVINDLATRALQLPRLVSYAFAARLPALTLAQRIYQDGTQAAALAALNKAVHPLFMPATVLALSTSS